MNWTDFPAYAYTAAALWFAGVLFVYLGVKKKALSVIGTLLVFAGLVTFALFITRFWISLGRPPMRTLGETRLMVWIFPACHRTVDIPPLEIQVVPGLCHHDDLCLPDHQPDASGNLR